MSKLFQQLQNDIRFREGMKACINCGTCTAICPAAEFYNYDPRQLVVDVQIQSEAKLEELLKSDTIWYCGECMSCKTRCPRGNVPGLIVMALRALSQDTGFFVESEKGRQQLAIKRTVGECILQHGYCIIPEAVVPEMHPEQGEMWKWVHQNQVEVYRRLGANYQGVGNGALRKIPDEVLAELKAIFDVTGGTKRFEQIENCSAQKAKEMNLDLREGIDNEYFKYVYTNQK